MEQEELKKRIVNIEKEITKHFDYMFQIMANHEYNIAYGIEAYKVNPSGDLYEVIRNSIFAYKNIVSENLEFAKSVLQGEKQKEYIETFEKCLDVIRSFEVTLEQLWLQNQPKEENKPFKL